MARETEGRHAGQWRADFPVMPGPTPMLSRYGSTPDEAVYMLHDQAQADKLAQCWNDLIDWTLPSVAAERGKVGE